MSDIRQGRFKKLLVSPEQLQAEAPELSRRLAPLFAAWEQKTYSDVELVALSCLATLRLRHPRTWWGAKRAAPLHRQDLKLPLKSVPWAWSEEELLLLAPYETLGDLWSARAFKATPEAVHRSILAWSMGLYPLVLMERIPTVEEVLAQQVTGKRCVTVFRETSSLAKLILGERDALGFAYHDLIHADHFFHDNSLMKGQVGFYRQMHDLLSAGLLAPFMAKPEFPEQLDYLIADMNSHPVHLWKCFKSICRQADHAAMDELFLAQLPQRWQLSDSLCSALDELNGPRFNDDLAHFLLKFCESY